MVKTIDKIKNAAIELLFVRGEFQSNSEKIADYAKVRRPLIYYYFNSVEDLIDTIITETRIQRDQKILDILASEAELSEKIGDLFDVHLEQTIKYPFRQIYISTHKKELKTSKTIIDPDEIVIQKLKHLFDKELNKNNLRLNSSNQAILLLASYLNYPLLMISLGPRALELSKVEYINLLKERKSIFISLVFKN